MTRKFAILALALALGLCFSSGAFADDPSGFADTPTGDVSDITPMTSDGSPVIGVSGDGQTADANLNKHCGGITARYGSSDTTGTYYQYYSPAWCWDGTRIISVNVAGTHYPYVSGLYFYEGWDYAKIVSGGRLNTYAMIKVQSRFGWSVPVLGLTTHKTLIWCVELFANGTAAGPFPSC